MKLIVVLTILSLSCFAQTDRCVSTKTYDKMSVYSLKDRNYSLVKDTLMPWEVCFSESKMIYINNNSSNTYTKFSVLYFWQKGDQYNYEAIDSNKDTVYAVVHHDSLWHYLDLAYDHKLIRYYSKK